MKMFAAIDQIQTKSLMPMNFLGKILFPRRQPWEREREVKLLLITVLIALAFASIVGLVIFLKDYTGKY
jgi:type III secretory pathway component EscS